MKIPIKIRSRYLVTSFSTDMLLATFDNMAGLDNRLIYSFFHIGVDKDFYRLFDRYTFVKVVYDENIETNHPDIHIVAFMPQKNYTNKKMEEMFCDVIKYYYPNLY